jgi:signal transduction histidine kinase
MRRFTGVTARTRLTLGYAVLFALSGVAFATLVIWVTFAPVDSSLNEAEKLARSQQATTVKPTPSGEATGTAGSSAGGPPLGKITIASDEGLAAKNQARRELRERLFLAAGIGLTAVTAASAGVGWLMAGRVLRPVHAVSATARRLSQHDLHQRIPVAGPHDEMRELTETINSMLARLERAFAAQERFAANASHELRGPMTTLRALVDVAAAAPDASSDLRELAGELRGQLDRQQRVIDGLLALASSEHPVGPLRPVRLDLIASGALEAVAEEVADRGLDVSADLAPGEVGGDRVLLQLLVDNLVRNAVRHNTPGGRISVQVSERTLVVTNTGAEVTAQRLVELVEPFRRGNSDRVNGTAGTGGGGRVGGAGTGVVGDAGVGLGLAIADAVARSHGTCLRLTPRPGGGVTAAVTLPAGDPDYS